ncbi:HD domain-containing protein [Desulfovibrio intestinalis]|uniref:Putative nucleotidyltransferase with HDIG domain n=1 Tax=Desulfovibrio intestinalis TaxID=58621 RepID=A0A7W8BYU6_9BACT|nr:HD domain-containing protein [Desulfovibrio intestinalis]MBB5142481.1 putative nucleotidyltransferase with HDIG domain [Desulfovibrio intestinalis]
METNLGSASFIGDHEEWFAAYAANRCAIEAARPSGDVGPMHLKTRHSMAVLNNARRMVDSERFSVVQGRICLLAALYHDVGRFEQYLRFHTFKDKESCNHGQLGLRILKQEKRLDGEDPAIRKAVLAAVILHNRFALPEGLPEDTAIAAHVVRDADKLDILQVMDEHLKGPKPYNPTVVLSLPDTAGMYSEAVIQAALEGRVAAYADLRSVNDFRLLLGTWFFDMHFDSSRRQFVEDGHALNLLQGLPDFPPYKAVRQGLLEKLGALRDAPSY